MSATSAGVSGKPYDVTSVSSCASRFATKSVPEDRPNDFRRDAIELRSTFPDESFAAVGRQCRAEEDQQQQPEPSFCAFHSGDSPQHRVDLTRTALHRCGQRTSRVKQWLIALCRGDDVASTGLGAREPPLERSSPGQVPGGGVTGDIHTSQSIRSPSAGSAPPSCGPWRR